MDLLCTMLEKAIKKMLEEKEKEIFNNVKVNMEFEDIEKI